MPAATSYTSVPSLTIGGRLSTSAMRDLVELGVEEDIEGMQSLEARLLARGPADGADDFHYLDRTTLDFGTTLAVGVGPDTTGPPLFDGRVTALCATFPDESYATVTIKAEDALQDLRRTRRTRTFEDSTTADIAETLAGDHGLTPQIDLDGPRRRVVNQLNLSDLAFLRSIAQADGGELWLEGSTLHLQRRSDREAGELTLTYGGNLLSFDVRADLAHQCTDVAVTGWSVADKEAVSETGGTDAISGELGQDTSGAAVLAAAFGERHERVVVCQPLASDDARGRAEAAYRERARRFVTGSGTTAGSPTLRVGSRVTLNGLGSLFNGAYTVVRTRHRFDLAQGYTTDFDVERVGIGGSS